MPSYAVAYTPPPFSPLAKFGAGILGYDCFEGADVKQRAVPGIDPALLSLLTVAPRRAGFQATVVPPFSLHERRENELRQAVATLAQDHHPMLLGPLSFAYVGAFIVLRTEKTSARLRQFAGACRAAFEPFSTPAAADSSDDFAFRIRIAGPTDTPDEPMRHLASAFEEQARDEVEFGSISLMRQDDPAARFRVLACKLLTGR